MMMDLLQELGGSRMHYNFPRIGGVKRDLPHGFALRARHKLKLFLDLLIQSWPIWPCTLKQNPAKHHYEI